MEASALESIGLTPTVKGFLPQIKQKTMLHGGWIRRWVG